MEGTIRFPHLGITLTNVIKSFSVGGISIACYGVILAVAMMTGLFLVTKVAKATGQKEENYFDLGVIAIVVAVICARIYYVVFSWDYYSSHLAEIINLRKGGLAIYGGVIGGVITVLVYCHVKKMNCRRALDTMSVGLVWGQALGRWGNFFNREAFGDYTDNLFAMQLPVSDVRASEITETMREHLQAIDGVEYIQVHPTFLYESLWNLGVFLVLLAVTRHRYRRNGNVDEDSGMVFLLYLLLYGAGRFWIEGLRTDQLILFGTGLPVSQVLSGILIVLSGLLLIRMLVRKRRMQRNPRVQRGTEENGQKRAAGKKN